MDAEQIDRALHGKKGVQVGTVYSGKLGTRMVHGPSGAELTTAAPVDNHGDGSSFSPTDLVAGALTACMQTIAALRSEALGKPLRRGDVEMKATKVMTSSGPRRIAEVAVTAKFARDYTAKEKKSMIRAAKECPVKRSLHPSVRVPALFLWADGTCDSVDLTK